MSRLLRRAAFAIAAAIGALVAVPNANAQAPSACEQMVFMMFYEYGTPTMPPSAWEVVELALTGANDRGCRLRTVSLYGEMDREWDDRTGTAIAERRIDEMVNYLVGLGLPRGLVRRHVVFTEGRTAEGVRDPMGRSVDLVFEFY